MVQPTIPNINLNLKRKKNKVAFDIPSNAFSGNDAIDNKRWQNRVFCDCFKIRAISTLGTSVTTQLAAGL